MSRFAKSTKFCGKFLTSTNGFAQFFFVDLALLTQSPNKIDKSFARSTRRSKKLEYSRDCIYKIYQTLSNFVSDMNSQAICHLSFARSTRRSTSLLGRPLQFAFIKVFINFSAMDATVTNTPPAHIP